MSQRKGYLNVSYSEIGRAKPRNRQVFAHTKAECSSVRCHQPIIVWQTPQSVLWEQFTWCSDSKAIDQPWTTSLARLLAVPETLAAVHWNHAESSGLADEICRDDLPASVWIRYRPPSSASDNIRPSFCQPIIGTGTPTASVENRTVWPSTTVWLVMRSTKRGGAAAALAENTQIKYGYGQDITNDVTKREKSG